MKVPLYGVLCAIAALLLTEYSSSLSYLTRFTVWMAVGGCMVVSGAILQALIVNQRWWGEDRYDQHD